MPLVAVWAAARDPEFVVVGLFGAVLVGLALAADRADVIFDRVHLELIAVAVDQAAAFVLDKTKPPSPRPSGRL